MDEIEMNYTDEEIEYHQRTAKDNPQVQMCNGESVFRMQQRPQPQNQIGTLRQQLARVEAELQRKERRLPKPFSRKFRDRFLVTMAEEKAEFRPVVEYVLEDDHE